MDAHKGQKVYPILTQENHPENQPEAPPVEPVQKTTLFRTIAISAFAGLIGMTYGVTALSSALVLNDPVSFYSMIPLVGALVVIVSGWVGSMIWMCSNDGREDHEI
jgi:hypothetical protein